MTTQPGGMVWLGPDLEMNAPGQNGEHPPRPGSFLYCAGEPQGQWLQEMTPEDIRTTLVQIAATSAGMFADPNKDRTGYDVLIAPGESEQMTRDMRKMSGCALAVRAWFRLAGIVDRQLCPPYKVGNAFNDVYNVALDAGAVGKARFAPNARGLIVAMGRGMRTHIALVAFVDATGKAWSIDGGQVDAHGSQCIAWRQRTAHLNQAGLVYALDDREIIWTIDPAELAARYAMQWRLPWRFGSPIQVPPFELHDAARALGDPNVYEGHDMTPAELARILSRIL